MTQVPLRVKAMLIGYTWLGFALDESSTDELLKAQLQHSRSLPPDVVLYDPYRYEDMLQAVSDLLDRCLTYRREYEELSAAAIRQGLEYQLFKAQQPSVQALETASWQAGLRSIDAGGQATAAAAFGIIEDPIGKGFQAAAQSAGVVAKQAADAEVTRQMLVKNKRDVLSSYQSSLEQRHTTPGHPLNYTERAAKVRKFLLEDFVEAAEKSRAIGIGVERVHRLSLGQLWLNSDTPLDDLVSWVRGIIRELDRRSHSDIRLILGWFMPTNKLRIGLGPQPLGPPSGSSDAFTAKQEQWSSIRIRSMSAKFLFKPGQVSTPYLVESQIVVFPGNQPPMVLEDVTNLWSDTQTSVAGKSMLNVPLFPNFRSEDIVVNSTVPTGIWPDPNWLILIPKLVYADATQNLNTADLLPTSGIRIKLLLLAQRANGF